MSMRIWLLVASRRSFRAEFILECIILFRCILDSLLKSSILGIGKLEQKCCLRFVVSARASGHSIKCSMFTDVDYGLFISATAHVTTNRYNLDKPHRSRPIIWRDTNAFRLKVIEWFIFNWTRNTWSKEEKKMRDNDLITPSHFDQCSWTSNAFSVRLQTKIVSSALKIIIGIGL